MHLVGESSQELFLVSCQQGGDARVDVSKSVGEFAPVHFVLWGLLVVSKVYIQQGIQIVVPQIDVLSGLEDFIVRALWMISLLHFLHARQDCDRHGCLLLVVLGSCSEG